MIFLHQRIGYINIRDNHWSTRGLTATVALNDISFNQLVFCHRTPNYIPPPTRLFPPRRIHSHIIGCSRLCGCFANWYIGTLVHFHINQHISTSKNQHITPPSSSLSPAHLLLQLLPCSQFRERMNLVVKYAQNVSYPIKLVQ